MYTFENAILGSYLTSDFSDTNHCKLYEVDTENSEEFYVRSYFRILEPGDPIYDAHAGRAHYTLESGHKQLLESSNSEEVLVDEGGTTWLIEHYPDNSDHYLIMNVDTKELLTDEDFNTQTVSNIAELSSDTNDIGSAWLLEDGPAGGHYIKNTATSNYLALVNDSLRLNADTPVEWHFEYVEEARDVHLIPSNIYIMEKNAGLFLQTVDTNDLGLEQFLTDPNQTWSFQYGGAEQYRIMNDQTNSYLIIGATTATSLSIGDLSTGSGGFHIIHDLSNGDYKFKDPSSDNYLGAVNGAVEHTSLSNLVTNEDSTFVEWQLVSNPSSKINLALNKNASQSSTCLNNTANNAVDGNTQGDISIAPISVTQNISNEPTWWEVDLGGMATIEDITIYTAWGYASECQSAYSLNQLDVDVFISDQRMSSDVQSATLLDDPNVSSYNLVMQIEDGHGTITMPNEQFGRYVRVQLVNTYHLSLAECEVYGHWGTYDVLEPMLNDNINQGGLRYTARINESGSGERIYSGIHDMATMMDVKVSEGYIYIAQDGWYGFQQGGPSTMKLSINGQVIFNQNGSNDIGYNDQMNWLALKAGYHTIEVIKNNTNYEGGLLWQPLHGEIANIPSEVLYYKTDFIGETGTILGEQDAAESFEYTIEYLGDYTDPVVILSANTTGGIGDPITLKVDTETNSDSFTVQLAEWSYLDKIHVLESIDYMVVEAGYYTDFMGYQGVNLLAKNEWVSGKENIITEVNLWDENDSDIFTSTPLVLHQPQTANGTDPFISRIFNVSNSRLEVILQKEAANRDTNPGQPNEKIGFVALDTGTQSDYREAAFIAENQIVLNDDWTELNMASVLDAYGDGNKVVLMHTQTMEHDLRTYPAGTVQGRNLDGTSYDGEIYYQQEASQGSTMVTGLYETLGFVAFGNHQLLSASQQWDIDDATDITGTTYLLGDSYWTMQDGQDRISQVDGTAYNGAQFSNSGLLSLDGDAYVNLGYHHNVTKDFTIKAKFSYNTTSTVQTIIAKNNGSPHEVQYALCIDEDGRMLFEYNRANNGFALHGKTQLESYQTNNSAWHEVELRVHDDLTIELIVNDVLEDIAVAPAETIPTTAILFIGKTGGNFHSRFFGGQIDFISFEHSTPAKFGEIYYWDMFTTWYDQPRDVVPGNGNALKLGMLQNGASLSNGVLVLDGDNDYVTFGSDGIYEVTNDYSIRARVKSDGGNNKQAIISKYEGSNNRPYLMYLENDKVRFQYKEDGHLRELISSDINTTDWNDIMVRISDLELELWCEQCTRRY